MKIFCRSVLGLFIVLFVFFSSEAFAERDAAKDVQARLLGEASSPRAIEVAKVVKQPFRVIKEGANFIIISFGDGTKKIFSFPMEEMEKKNEDVSLPNTSRKLSKNSFVPVQKIKERLILPPGLTGDRSNSTNIQFLNKDRISSEDLRDFGNRVKAVQCFGCE